MKNEYFSIAIQATITLEGKENYTICYLRQTYLCCNKSLWN